jgi:hypothetical protein
MVTKENQRFLLVCKVMKDIVRLIATELRRVKNPKTVNRIKQDIMNLVFDTLNEEQDL